VSDIQPANGVFFISRLAGWYGHWHPAPERQVMLCLTPELAVTVSDDQKCRFGPGSPVLSVDSDLIIDQFLTSFICPGRSKAMAEY
jgi:hypothetical protein